MANVKELRANSWTADGSDSAVCPWPFYCESECGRSFPAAAASDWRLEGNAKS